MLPQSDLIRNLLLLSNLFDLMKRPVLGKASAVSRPGSFLLFSPQHKIKVFPLTTSFCHTLHGTKKNPRDFVKYARMTIFPWRLEILLAKLVPCLSFLLHHRAPHRLMVANKPRMFFLAKFSVCHNHISHFIEYLHCFLSCPFPYTIVNQYPSFSWIFGAMGFFFPVPNTTQTSEVRYTTLLFFVQFCFISFDATFASELYRKYNTYYAAHSRNWGFSSPQTILILCSHFFSVHTSTCDILLNHGVTVVIYIVFITIDFELFDIFVYEYNTLFMHLHPSLLHSNVCTAPNDDEYLKFHENINFTLGFLYSAKFNHEIFTGNFLRKIVHFTGFPLQSLHGAFLPKIVLFYLLPINVLHGLFILNKKSKIFFITYLNHRS